MIALKKGKGIVLNLSVKEASKLSSFMRNLYFMDQSDPGNKFCEVVSDALDDAINQIN